MKNANRKTNTNKCKTKTEKRKMETDRRKIKTDAGGYILTHQGADAPGWISVFGNIRAEIHQVGSLPPNVEGRKRARFQIFLNLK